MRDSRNSKSDATGPRAPVRRSDVAFIWGGPAYACRESVRFFGRSSLGWGLVFLADAFSVSLFEDSPIKVLIHVDAPMYYGSILRHLYSISGTIIHLESRTRCPNPVGKTDSYSDWMESTLADLKIEPRCDLVVDASDVHWALTGQTGIEDLQDRYREYDRLYRPHLERIRAFLKLPTQARSPLLPTLSNLNKYADALRGIPVTSPQPQFERREDDHPWGFELAKFINMHSQLQPSDGP